MKKFSVLSIVLFVGLVLVGCSSLPSKTPTILEGIWKQVDGSAVFTFRNNKYELVDMERGVAGYGKIKLYIKDGIETIEFINDNILDIMGSTHLHDPPNERYKLKQFQRLVFEEYHKIHPEQMEITKKKLAEEGDDGGPIEYVDRYTHSGSGGFYVPYILDGDMLNIHKHVWPRGKILFYDDSFIGRFVRQ